MSPMLRLSHGTPVSTTRVRKFRVCILRCSYDHATDLVRNLQELNKTTICLNSPMGKYTMAENVEPSKMAAITKAYVIVLFP